MDGIFIMKKMEKEKSTMKMVNYYLKENIDMVKDVEKAKNIIALTVNYHLKENI